MSSPQVDSTTRTLSVVVAVYNSEQSLPELVHRFNKMLPEVANSFEVIFVNDGSLDRSWQVIGELEATSSAVRGINLMRNYGQHNALLCGIRAAGFDLLVTMDDDLQHPPEQMARLLARLHEGYDVVYGSPEAEQNGFLRGIASRLTRFALQAAVGPEVAQNVSAFRLFHTQLREAFQGYQTPFVSIDVLLTWATSRFGAITVPFYPRHSGKSKLHPLRERQSCF